MIENFNVKNMVAVIFTFIVLPAGIYYFYSPGGYFAKQKAIKSVQGVNISIMISNTKENYTLEKLIREYNFEKKTLGIVIRKGLIGDLNDKIDSLGDTSLPWEVQYIGGKFAVGCRYQGHLISFETDTINVTPISDDAKEIFNLKYSSFSR
ncbi:MAG: hypothetical protein WCJ56_07265 [bacterium]